MGPITHAPSLQSGEVGFPRTLEDLWEHADHDEVLRELRAQVERALAWGIDVTHLAPHLSAITLRPEFFDVYLELAVEFRAADPPAVDDLRRAGRVPVPAARRRRGVVFPDHFDHDWRAGSAPGSRRDRHAPAGRHRDPRPAAIDTPEVRRARRRRRRLDRRPRARSRATICRTGSTPAAPRLIGFRDLRDAMRALTTEPHGRASATRAENGVAVRPCDERAIAAAASPDFRSSRI